MSSSHLILRRPLLLLPPISPSIKVVSNESTLHMRCPKYWSFSFSIIPCKEIPVLISFRMDWLDLLAVQGTLVGDVENKPLSLSYAVFFFFYLFSLFLKLNLLPLLLFSLKSCLILCNHVDWLKNNRLPCPLLSPRVCSNSCTLSWWCYLTISSPFSPALNLSQH